VQDIEWTYSRVLYHVRNAVLVVYVLAEAAVQNISAVYYRVRSGAQDTAGRQRDELESDDDYAA
jgi:hypothetical protein